MKTSSPRLTPTPSEAPTLSDSELDAEAVKFDAQAEDFLLDPGSQPPTTTKDKSLAVTSAVTTLLGESSTSGSMNDDTGVLPSIGKRKERADEHEPEKREVELADANNNDTEIVETSPLPKKRRIILGAHEEADVDDDLKSEQVSVRHSSEIRQESAAKSSIPTLKDGDSVATAAAVDLHVVSAPVPKSNIGATEPVEDDPTPPRKKARLIPESPGDVESSSAMASTANRATETESAQPPLITNKPCPLLTLPLELLAEILILTGSPKHVLATARTCKTICHTLLNSSSQFIWRETRKGSECSFEHTPIASFDVSLGLFINPAPPGVAVVSSAPPRTKVVQLPDPPNNFFGEAAYAAFVFDTGECETCKSETSLMYTSFALRARFCKNSKCMHRLDEVPSLHHMRPGISMDQNLLEILPTNETRFFARGAVAYSPPPGLLYCRTDAMEAAQTEYIAKFRDDEYKKKFELLKKRKLEWMQFCTQLRTWREARDLQYKRNRSDNESTIKIIASRYGWEYDNLMVTSYADYHRHKNKLIEQISKVDIKVMKKKLESEILALAEKRERRNGEISLMKNREDVEGVYNRLRSAKTYPYLPSLATFRKLPVVDMLQSADRPTPVHSVTTTLQNDKVMKDLLASQLKKWTQQAKDDLGVALGFNRKWKSANKNILHPVERVTARFLCVKCERVDTKYRGDECLDFAGACVHQCGVGNQKKGKVKKGKQALWDANNFVKDDKAIKVLKKSVEELGFAEDRHGGNYLLKVGFAVVCMSCEPCMVLDSRNLMGHSHRHDDMQISFVSLENIVSYLGGFPYVYGLAQTFLASSSLAAKKEIERKNYGCRHCLREKQATIPPAMVASTSDTPAGCDAAPPNQDLIPQPSSSGSSTPSATPGQIELSTVVYRMHDLGTEGPLERPPPLFSFNGIRSHLKSKHQIEGIRDEDIFCYKSPDIEISS